MPRVVAMQPFAKFPRTVVIISITIIINRALLFRDWSLSVCGRVNACYTVMLDTIRNVASAVSMQVLSSQ